MFRVGLFGLIAGFISGMFGAGGGLILVPVFVHLMRLSEKQSRATAVFCIFPLVIITGVLYGSHNLIDWDIAIKAAIGGIIGSYIGAKMLKRLNDKILKILFIVFLIFVGIKYILNF